MVRNRAVWTVDHIHPDGSLTATGKNGTIRLPASYVAEHVERAYAPTVMAAQGRNVQGGASFYDKRTDVRNLYVAMTRCTGMNEAFMVTNGEQTAVDIFAQSIATDWIDLPAHARRSRTPRRATPPPGLLDGANSASCSSSGSTSPPRSNTPRTPCSGYPPNGSKPNEPR